MNHGTVTGGVVKAADNAYTPATFDAPSLRKVVFAIAVTDSHRQKAFWNCEAEGDDGLMDKLIAEAQPGRGIKLEYELATRPFYKTVGRTKVHSGEVRFLRVIGAEFPERGAPAPEPVEAAG